MRCEVSRRYGRKTCYLRRLMRELYLSVTSELRVSTKRDLDTCYLFSTYLVQLHEWWCHQRTLVLIGSCRELLVRKVRKFFEKSYLVLFDSCMVVFYWTQWATLGISESYLHLKYRNYLDENCTMLQHLLYLYKMNSLKIYRNIGPHVRNTQK